MNTVDPACKLEDRQMPQKGVTLGTDFLTDCKEALREAVSRPSERISPLELSAEHAFQA